MRTTFLIAMAVLLLTSCNEKSWELKLAHTSEGIITDGSKEELVAAVRNGCDIRVAWGARRAADPTRTIEHAARPVWISIRDEDSVEVQLEDFIINLSVLGEPPEDHEVREPFGGVEKVVRWSANLKTDGSFDAVWYYPHSGEFIRRIPQRHPMKWFADCRHKIGAPLFPPTVETQEE